MNVQNDGKLLLFLDILGFKDYVKQNPPDRIYEKINECLLRYYEVETISSDFSTIYFSDTIVLYSKKGGFTEDSLTFLLSTAGKLFSLLLASRIPIRGTISYGPFEVKRDKSNRNDIFFGDALIESYESQNNHNWIGISLCKSILNILDNKYTERLLLEGYLKQSNGPGKTLFLNPYRNLTKLFNSKKVNTNTDLDNELVMTEINAIKFINDQINIFVSRGDFISKEAVKYYSSFMFVNYILTWNNVTKILQYVEQQTDNSGSYQDCSAHW
jgi:hypothetical protein